MRQPDSPDTAVERAKRQVVLDSVLPDLNPVALQQSASEWTSSLNLFLDGGACEMVGATKTNPEWFFEGHETEFEKVIMV
jgi:hypothetical protein